MLAITGRLNETIKVDNDIKIVITAIQGKEVKLGINAPEDVDIVRGELYREIASTELRYK